MSNSKNGAGNKIRRNSRKYGSIIVASAALCTLITASSYAASENSYTNLSKSSNAKNSDKINVIYESSDKISDSVSQLLKETEKMKNTSVNTLSPSMTQAIYATVTSSLTSTTSATSVITTTANMVNTTAITAIASTTALTAESDIMDETSSTEVSESENDAIIEEIENYEDEDYVEDSSDSYDDGTEVYEDSNTDAYYSGGTYSSYVTDYEYMLLANTVGHEAGSSWISIYNKALVVEVIMNRVNNAQFPSTISDVLTQPNQFTAASTWSKWYADQGMFNEYVSEDCKTAVNYYFEHISEFQQGYLYFWGDGTQNHFS